MGETPCLFGEEGVWGLTAEAEGKEWGFIFSLLGSFFISFFFVVVDGRTRRTHWRCSGATQDAAEGREPPSYSAFPLRGLSMGLCPLLLYHM